MDAEYRDWHTGVELDRTTGRWLGYIEDVDHHDRRFVPARFGDSHAAELAADDLLMHPRKYAPVVTTDDAA